MADLLMKMASNQKMQENKPTLKFNFTLEKRWPVSKFSFWHSHWALMGKGAPHIHFLSSQFSLFLAISLDNTSTVRYEYTQSYTLITVLRPTTQISPCSIVPRSHSHSHIPHCSALSRSLSLLKTITPFSNIALLCFATKACPLFRHLQRSFSL